MPNKRKLFVVRRELIIPPFYGSNISRAIEKQVRDVMEVVNVYSPAGWSVWRASA